MTNRRRDVVTGGAGFIGSHLVDRLLAEGHEVTVLDNLSVGREKNLAAALGTGHCWFHRVDIREPLELAHHFQDVDTVYHLAALADIVPSIEKPAEYFTTNVDGTFNVVEAARKSGVRKLIYAASSSCYGIPDAYPTPEDAPIRPQYPYALTKYLGERIALHWGRGLRRPHGFSALFQRLRPACEDVRNVRCGVRCFPRSKTGGQAVHGRR
jgi:UDP-glucose 4-epimerase